MANAEEIARRVHCRRWKCEITGRLKARKLEDDKFAKRSFVFVSACLRLRPDDARFRRARAIPSRSFAAAGTKVRATACPSNSSAGCLGRHGRSNVAILKR